jgi:hypothetical protein
MRETWWRRLEALEKARALRDAPLEVRYIGFVDRDGNEIEPTFARGPGDFICHRAANETLADFSTRATAECLTAKPRVPVAILVFLTEEASDAALR